jgi:hypothetical protein
LVKGDDDRLRRAKQKKQLVVVGGVFKWKGNVDDTGVDFTVWLPSAGSSACIQ